MCYFDCTLILILCVTLHHKKFDEKMNNIKKYNTKLIKMNRNKLTFYDVKNKILVEKKSNKAK